MPSKTVKQKHASKAEKKIQFLKNPKDVIIKRCKFLIPI